MHTDIRNAERERERGIGEEEIREDRSLYPVSDE